MGQKEILSSFLMTIHIIHCFIYTLLENKSEVQDILREYVYLVEAHWNTRVSKIHRDNGKEYMNKNVLTWCK